MSTNTATGHEGTDSATTLDERDRRALEQYLTVLEDIGQAKDADDLYLVVSQSGKEYLVDRRERVCECPDYQYRSPEGGCKHLRRVAFATGERAIPAGVDHDPQLGEHVTGGPRYAASDGGVETTDAAATTTTTTAADSDGETETKAETEADTKVEAANLDEASTMDRDTHDAPATIVAQTTSTTADLPDWNVYNAACKASVATIERLIDESTDDADGRDASKEVGE